jgi:hypothetical protein
METNLNADVAAPLYNGASISEHASNVAEIAAAAPAGMAEVMFEQLQYLVGHSHTECPSGCLACARLKVVQNWLLLPFVSSPIQGNPVIPRELRATERSHAPAA